MTDLTPQARIVNVASKLQSAQARVFLAAKGDISCDNAPTEEIIHYIGTRTPCELERFLVDLRNQDLENFLTKPIVDPLTEAATNSGSPEPIATLAEILLQEHEVALKQPECHGTAMYYKDQIEILIKAASDLTRDDGVPSSAENER